MFFEGDIKVVVFTLAELFYKITNEKWQGQINFYPSKLVLDTNWMKSYADHLSQTMKVEFGDRVVVSDEVSPHTIVTLLWLWSQGAVIVPVRHNLDTESVNRIAQDCHAKFYIHNGECTVFNHVSSNDVKFNCHSKRRVCGSDLALIIYTSGSTGKPKGIMLSHSNVVTAMYSIANYLTISSQEHILCLSPLSFDYGLYQLLFSLSFDCHLTLYEEEFHPIKVINAIGSEEITLLPVVPAMASSLSKIIQVFKKTLPSLVKLTNTGGHLGEDTIKLLTSLLPELKIYAMYGLTECKRALYLPPEDTARKPGSVGIPIPGLEAKIFTQHKENDNNHYKEVSAGEIGELYIRSATLMQGYYGDGNAGASILNGQYRDDNWLATGDLFSQDQEGYFYFKGRSKDLIKQAGFCLYPAELEALIEQHLNVHLCAIVPHSDKFGDEIACLHVQLVETSMDKQNAFKHWLDGAVEASYRPREIRFIEKIALTENSKVDKQSLIASL